MKRDDYESVGVDQYCLLEQQYADMKDQRIDPLVRYLLTRMGVVLFFCYKMGSFLLDKGFEKYLVILGAVLITMLVGYFTCKPFLWAKFGVEYIFIDDTYLTVIKQMKWLKHTKKILLSEVEEVRLNIDYEAPEYLKHSSYEYSKIASRIDSGLIKVETDKEAYNFAAGIDYEMADQLMERIKYNVPKYKDLA